MEENGRRDRRAPEYELLDAGVFDESRYFDIVVEYAKAATDDILIRITASNRGPEAAELHILPTLWFRNTWSWAPGGPRPTLRAAASSTTAPVIEADHLTLGRRWLVCEGSPALLFIENETNLQRLFDVPNSCPFVKDGINDYVVGGRRGAVNAAGLGTKSTVHYRFVVGAGASVALRLRLADAPPAAGALGRSFDRVFAQRVREADEFYATVIPAKISPRDSSHLGPPRPASTCHPGPPARPSQAGMPSPSARPSRL